MVSTRIPATTAAMIFLCFLLYMDTPLFLKALKGCDKMPLLFSLTFIILVFLFFRKSRQKNTGHKSEEFWKREREAGFVPAKDLTSLDYLSIPYSSLPFRYYTPGTDGPERIGTIPSQQLSPDSAEASPELLEVAQSSSYMLAAEHIAPLAEELAEAERSVCALSGKRILNLTGISNTELRLTYGTASLEPLTVCDQNFTVLIRTLQKWGALLVSSGNPEDAVTVLSYAVSIGSDIAGTYTLLARLYRDRGELSKIEALKSSAELLTTLMKPSILRDLELLTAGLLQEQG